MVDGSLFAYVWLFVVCSLFRAFVLCLAYVGVICLFYWLKLDVLMW